MRVTYHFTCTCMHLDYCRSSPTMTSSSVSIVTCSNSSLGSHLLLTCPLHAGMDPVSVGSGLMSGTSGVYKLTMYIIELRKRSQGFQEFAEYALSCEWMFALDACHLTSTSFPCIMRFFNSNACWQTRGCTCPGAPCLLQIIPVQLLQLDTELHKASGYHGHTLRPSGMD
jgi:hypothetical protein